MRYFVVFRQTDDALRAYEDDRVEVDHMTYQRLFKDAWENEKAGAP
jgi:hypothetical protein